MGWRIGIDEAGYGPNLGPLAMAAFAWRVPDAIAEADRWETLGVRRRRAKSAALWVDDSKKVYRGGDGLDDLERATLAALGAPAPTTFAEFLARVGNEPLGAYGHDGAAPLPRAASLDAIVDATARLDDACAKAGVADRRVFLRLVGPAEFNALVDRHGSKGAVLAVGLLDLLRQCLAQTPAEDATAIVDKHGGRNQYAAILQELSPDAWVTPEVEGARESAYRVAWSDRTLRVVFRPEADATSFETALASLVAKYARETCMAELNAYWRTHLPDLAPTAGYPVDAARYLAEIRSTIDRLRLPIDAIWRRR